MKIKYKKALVIACICILSGLTFMVIGSLLGCDTGITIDKSGIKILRKLDYNYETEHITSLSNISLDIDNANVYIKESSDNTYYAVLDMKGIISEPDVTCEEDNLSIAENNNGIILVDFDIFSSKKSVITLYIPANSKLDDISISFDNGTFSTETSFEVDKLTIDSDNGVIDIPNITCTSQVNISSDNGSIKVSGNLNGTTIFKTNNGSINATGTYSGKTTITSDNGHVTTDGTFDGTTKLSLNNGSITTSGSYSGDTTFESSNGKLILSGNYSDSLYAKTSNGKIQLDGQLQGNSTLKTTNGSITVNVSGSRHDYDISTKTTNGSTKIDGDKVSQDYAESNTSNISNDSISATTTNGSININFSK